MRHLTNVYYKCSVKFLFCAFKISGRSRGGARGAPPPSYLWTKLSPEGPKKIWGGPGSPRCAPLLSKGLGDCPPPPSPPPAFISRSGSGT